MTDSRPTSRRRSQPGNEPDAFERAKEALRPEAVARHPGLQEAAALLRAGRFETAKELLRNRLNDRPTDVRALHLLAQAAVQEGGTADAEALLRRCLEVAPDFTPSRYLYTNLLMDRNRPEGALIQAEELVKRDPRNPLFRVRKATILEKIGDYGAAAAIWRGLTDDYPSNPGAWERYGHTLRIMGLLQDAIGAYRRQMALDSHSGTPWWHLADVKTFRFEADEIERMESELANAEITARDRTYFHFSLGKAYGDLKLYERSFSHYARGNAIRRVGVAYDPAVSFAYVARCKATLKEDFFGDRADLGSDSRAPIFLVGMPRSGSTLVEQMLASHSLIEGTTELTDLPTISTELQKTRNRGGYPEVLESLDAEALRVLGESYLESAGAYRKLGRPFFTDKMGANYLHIGLIQLILPNAKIVDVRRHPMACCFSNFVQIFPHGQDDAYRLADIGQKYRGYIELMAHFDRVLPGKVHRLFYEDLVAKPEAEIRRLLDFLGLCFDEACLAFHASDRVVTTISSEQVRQPIYRDALERWKPYEPWLGPLKTALGPVLDSYPAVPLFD